MPVVSDRTEMCFNDIGVFTFEIDSLVPKHSEDCLQTISDLLRHATIIPIPTTYVNFDHRLITFTTRQK